MAITANEIKRMQRDIVALKKDVARLKRKDSKRRASPRVLKPTALSSHAAPSSENERVLALLRSKGMTAELTPEEKMRARRWQVLPEEEKKRIVDEFFNLKLDKQLSDIIIENRR